VLVVTQFAISQVLIIGTIIAVKQMNYIRQADLGYNKDAILLLDNITDSASLPKVAYLRQQLQQVGGVQAVSFSADAPSSSNDWSSNFYFNHAAKDEPFDIFIKVADTAYFNTFQLQMVAGRPYTASDTTSEVVVNEMLCNKLGIRQPKDIIGKDIRLGGKWYPITGVVKDFKASSLREEVRPAALFCRKEYYSTIGIKLSTAGLSSALPAIRDIWERTYPDYVYNASFLDEKIARFYEQETQLAVLYKLFAGIAIFISCLGVYGLISFLAIQKTKEVGIRKTLGASAASIVVLFSKEFTLLVVVAFIIAMPVGWWLMHQWLQHFVYRISMEITIFLLAIAISLLIAWLTVSYKAIKASLANPVKSLQNN
jgi:ABC-type antimicrobial peptide transport system permease subunit